MNDKDWRESLMDREYQRLAGKKVAPPEYEDFYRAVSNAWEGVIKGIEWRFFTGIQSAMLPGPVFDPDDLDEDGVLDLLDWSEDIVDPRGQPVTFYDPDFEKRFLELLVEYGIFETVERAGLYLGLADRYCNRGEWMQRLMTEMWLELPSLDGQEIKDFYQRRSSEGQLSLLAALGWA